MKATYKNTLFFVSVGICAVLLLCRPVSAAKVTEMRFWAAPDHARVVLDLTEPVQYSSTSQENPPQLHLELRDVSLSIPRKELEVNDPFLTKISIIDLKKKKVKLVFHQKKPLNVNIFPLKPYQDKPHRLVIDLIDLAQEKKDQEDREKQKEIKQKEMKIVVVDPGHGGEDPGAVGRGRTMEKDVVLKIAQKVIQQLNPYKEIRPFLTRKGDYFIPLEQRVKIAREYGADLFVSIHADASFNPQARGASVYCLSLSGATDEAARVLAQKENMSNVLGGAFLRPASLSKDPNLNQILLDLMQNNSLKESFRLAETILDEVKVVNSVKFSGYRQANFVVLRAPDIPSVLVETAYISNREDERLLIQNEFQDKMARSLTESIRKFFRP
jgi:N-acetylmuramoyl-L-alanine amidase